MKLQKFEGFSKNQNLNESVDVRSISRNLNSYIEKIRTLSSNFSQCDFYEFQDGDIDDIKNGLNDIFNDIQNYKNSLPKVKINIDDFESGFNYYKLNTNLKKSVSIKKSSWFIDDIVRQLNNFDSSGKYKKVIDHLLHLYRDDKRFAAFHVYYKDIKNLLRVYSILIDEIR